MTSNRLVGQLIRFFAHLVLLLGNLGEPVPNDASNLILQAYLQVLEQEGDRGLVAMYAACLREGNGEESYARFLKCERAYFKSRVALLILGSHGPQRQQGRTD